MSVYFASHRQLRCYLHVKTLSYFGERVPLGTTKAQLHKEQPLWSDSRWHLICIFTQFDSQLLRADRGKEQALLDQIRACKASNC